MTNTADPCHRSDAITVIAVVNARDCNAPITGSEDISIRLRDTRPANLSVLLNGVSALHLGFGLDADGHTTIQVPLGKSQQEPIFVGPLNLKVTKNGSDGKGIVAESLPVTVDIVPGFSSFPKIDNIDGQIVFGMTLPVPPRSKATTLLYGRGKMVFHRITCVRHPDAASVISAPLAGITPGDYFVGVEIDGLPSPFDLDEP